MGAIPFCPSTSPSDLALSNSPTSSPPPNNFTTSFRRSSSLQEFPPSEFFAFCVSAPAHERLKNWPESRDSGSACLGGNALERRRCVAARSFSSSKAGAGGLRSAIRGAVGFCTARLELRFMSLSDLTGAKNWASIQCQGLRRPFYLSRRWCNYYKPRVICAARREDDGGRQQGRSSSQEADTVDHYKVLGLRRRATASAIKFAYRQLARQFHPDVNKDADANEKFMSVRLAYEVLSDEASRKLYDSSLQEQVKASRRKQVYQRRERDTWLRSRHNKSHFRRAPYENTEWSYSMYSYENEYSNMESYYYTYPSTAIFSNTKKKSSNRGKSPEKDIKQQDWQLDLQAIGREALFFLWVVSAMWHALGAQTALGLLVGSLALWKDFAVGYRLASGVALLMGGEKGLALMVALIVTTRVFGKAYHAVAAIVTLALWLGGGVLKSVPLPHGAILVLVYKCIQLQSFM